MGSNHPCDVCYKVLLLGESGVGKTAMIKSITGMPFDPESVPTIGTFTLLLIKVHAYFIHNVAAFTHKYGVNCDTSSKIGMGYLNEQLANCV